MKVLVKTLHGLEDLLLQELQTIGFTHLQKRKRAIACEGSLAQVYQANLELRTALRILLPVYDFQARNEKELYDKIYSFDWSEYLDKRQTFAIDNTVFSEYFRHSRFAALKTKDAIVDQFRDKYGMRPSIDTERPDVLLNLHAFKDRFSVSLDSSGDPLNQRGYREKGHRAPLNEILAAGMIKLSGWRPETPLIDPFCGSGTILIEAAMIAREIAPNLHRKDFGFVNWENFQPMLWNRIKMDVRAKAKNKELKISGGDIDPYAVSMTQRSLKNIGIRREDIKVRKIDFLHHHPLHKTGMIITNPPYGERMGSDIHELYSKMGDHLRKNYPGYTAWILSSNKKAFKQLHLKPNSKIELYNGSLECEFCEYQLFV